MLLKIPLAARHLVPQRAQNFPSQAALYQAIFYATALACQETYTAELDAARRYAILIELIDA
jgi:hypothetical protein